MDNDKIAQELVYLARELVSSSAELKRLQQMYDLGVIDQDEYEKKKAEIESGNQSGYGSQHDLVNDLKSSGWKDSGGGQYADMLSKTIGEVRVIVYSTFLDSKKFSIWLYPSRAMSRVYDNLSDNPEFEKLSKQEFSVNKVRSPEGLESLAKDMIKNLKDKFPAKRKQTEYANLEYEGKTGEEALAEWRKDVESMIVDLVESSYDFYVKERAEAEKHDARRGVYGGIDSLAHAVWTSYTGGWVSLKNVLYEILESGGKAYRIQDAMENADINSEKEVKKVLDMLVRKKRIIDENGRQLSFDNMTYYSIRRRFE